MGILPRLAFLPFYTAEYVVKKMVIWFCGFFGGDVSVEQKRMIIGEFYRCINFMIVLLITYNWFFVLFYKENDIYVNVPSYDSAWLDNMSSFARFFFEYSLTPITFFHNIFTSRNVGTSFYYYIFNLSRSKPLFQWLIIFLLVYFFQVYNICHKKYGRLSYTFL